MPRSTNIGWSRDVDEADRHTRWLPAAVALMAAETLPPHTAPLPPWQAAHDTSTTSLDRLVEWTARREPGDRNFPLF